MDDNSEDALIVDRHHKDSLFVGIHNNGILDDDDNDGDDDEDDDDDGQPRNPHS